MPYKSQAQQRYFHAAASRGDISPKVVREFDEATSSKQYAHLPEHVKEHDARGGLAGRLARRYYGGGYTEPEDEDDDESELQEEAVDEGEMPPGPGPWPQKFAEGGEARCHACGGPIQHHADGGEAEPEAEPAPREAKKDEHAPGWEGAEKINSLLPAWLSGRDAVLKKREQLRKLDEQTQEKARGGRVRRYAQGGQAEEAAQVLAGSDWQDERNRPRSPLAARLSGARISSAALRRLLEKGPATRVP
jgi:hypothetical protein